MKKFVNFVYFCTKTSIEVENARTKNRKRYNKRGNLLRYEINAEHCMESFRRNVWHPSQTVWNQDRVG